MLPATAEITTPTVTSDRSSNHSEATKVETTKTAGKAINPLTLVASRHLATPP